MSVRPALFWLQFSARVPGLESQYNKALTGTPGQTVEVFDPQGQPVPNGILLCRHHHTLIHDRLTITGDINHTLVFRRPDSL